MPQTFQVLRCYKCFTFQIHQLKKSNKWECKLCGEKQSIKRHYGIGTGKDCRMHVQKLNKMQGENAKTPSFHESDSDDTEQCECLPNVDKPQNVSKWSNYINTTEEVTRTDEPMYFQDQKVVLEIPKRTKTSKCKSQNYKQYQPNLGSRQVDDLSDVTYQRSKSNAVNSIILDSSTTHSKYTSETKSHITLSTLNESTKLEIENQVPHNTKNSIILNHTKDIFNNIPNNIPADQLQTSSKYRNQVNTEHKVKKSKWDHFIENDSIINDLYETNNTNCYISTPQKLLKMNFEKELNTNSCNQYDNTQSISKVSTNISKASMFAMSNDCDLDNLLNF